MKRTGRFLSILIASSLGMQCATPQQGSTRPAFITVHCAYGRTNRSQKRSEVQCTLANIGDKPAQVLFKKVSVNEPAADIHPVDIRSIVNDEFWEGAVVVLGVILVIGVLLVIASRNKSTVMPRIHVSAFEPGPSPSPPLVTRPSPPEKSPIYDTLVISGQGSATLLFAVRHGSQRPQKLILEFDDGQERILQIPINPPFGHSRGRSNFDY